MLIINMDGIQDASGGSMRFIGNVLVFLAVVGESSFVIFSKVAPSNISSLTRSFLICIFGVVLFLPLSVYELVNGYSFLLELDFWALTFYTGLILTVAAHILWFRSIVHVSGMTAAVFNSLIPVSGIILVFIFFGEVMSIVQITGLVVILLGVGMIVFSKEKKY